MTKAPGAVFELCAGGGRLYITAQRGLAGPELYRVGPGGGETPLSRFNARPAEAYRLAVPKALVFTNSRGSAIEGWVLKPPGLKKNESCPAVLSIHGGPKTVYGPALHHEMQHLAARGFAVLYCNPTGSDGGGDMFADIRGAYGAVDCEDILAFTDVALARNKYIDPARLGVLGGSYGGFMVNWLIGHTRRFKAAVSQRGISNWVSMALLSDIGRDFAPDQMGCTVWQNPEAVWDASPLKYAREVTTPTLFIHSGEDYRCPAAEGLQMYAALQLAGTPTRLCLFHGENHELSRSGKPQNRVRRLNEITRWFERYLI
jgi:dipeptidyl aminopeptidase/acylaminoacyl peptidase